MSLSWSNAPFGSPQRAWLEVHRPAMASRADQLQGVPGSIPHKLLNQPNPRSPQATRFADPGIRGPSARFEVGGQWCRWPAQHTGSTRNCLIRDSEFYPEIKDKSNESQGLDWWASMEWWAAGDRDDVIPMSQGPAASDGLTHTKHLPTDMESTLSLEDLTAEAIEGCSATMVAGEADIMGECEQLQNQELSHCEQRSARGGGRGSAPGSGRGSIGDGSTRGSGRGSIDDGSGRGGAPGSARGSTRGSIDGASALGGIDDGSARGGGRGGAPGSTRGSARGSIDDGSARGSIHY